MSRLLLLEPVGGIAGDMFMAAAIDLGVEPGRIEHALRDLPLPGWRLRVTRAQRHGISGTHVDVEVDAKAARHDHTSLGEIRRMISAAGGLSARAKERAQAIFSVLGEAEARVHGVAVDEVVFHEVGAVDSIVDVCAAAVVLELLGEPRVVSLPPPLGSGTVRSQHGVIPIPGPATLEILREVPVRFEGEAELTTPTGAALLKALATFDVPPVVRVERVGYGVGTKDFADRPNVLRASLGAAEAGAHPGVWTVEANLDDATPQLLADVVERALEVGALDAFISPVVMKKGRPGHLVSVLAGIDRREAIVDLLLAESTTLGVRWHASDRIALDRRFEEVETAYGRVRMKIGLREGRVLNAQPEFDDCRRIARERGVPVKDVLADALAAWRRR